MPGCKSLILFISRGASSGEKLNRVASSLEAAISTSADRVLFFEYIGKLIAEISEKKQSQEPVNALVTVSLEQDYSAVVGEIRDAVGKYLVELMRLCNFTNHSTARLQEFRKKIEGIGIPFRGKDVDKCFELATFGGLDYIANDGGYVACVL